MENEEIKAMSMGIAMTTIALLDSANQAQLNILVKEIVNRHRVEKNNMAFTFSNLAKEFAEDLKTGPVSFAKKVQFELQLLNGNGNINSFAELRNECPLICYVLIANIKAIATFDICQSINNRIYTAYVTAVQSLDGLI